MFVRNGDMAKSESMRRLIKQLIVEMRTVFEAAKDDELAGLDFAQLPSAEELERDSLDAITTWAAANISSQSQ